MDLGLAHLQACGKNREGYLRNLLVLLPCRICADAGIKKWKFLYRLPGKVCSTISNSLRKLVVNNPFFWCIQERATKAEPVPHIPRNIFFIKGVIFLARR